MNIPLFSIIIPVYKVEQYLPECIDSIIKQTFTNFELLLIDDGSPDRSAEICDAYALKDNRIHVFHEKNGGVSFARNIGLDNAQGKWITFIDSDDWVEKDYLEKIYAEVVSFNADLIVWSIVHRYANYSSLKDIRKKGCFDEKNDILECLMFLDMNGLLRKSL
ncbi:glycosyltransferase [Bacteroides salyersiae]|nr:glycosyltransferase [Bacteroides salyersiae]